MDQRTHDLSARFRRVYLVALTGGVVMTVLAAISSVHDIDMLRDESLPSADDTLDAMVRGALYRAGATIVLLAAVWRFVLRPMAVRLAEDRRRLQEAEDLQREVSARQALDVQIHAALDMTESEEDVHRVVARAMARIAPDLPAELLLADSSRAHLEQVAVNPLAGAPGCDVPSPHSCPAVRRGTTTVFSSSEEIDACPHLASRPGDACSAVCVPVSSMGRNLGVLHVTGPEGAPPASERTDPLTVVAGQAGGRIGNLRILTRFQLQASTDGLTGLSNRRATTELLGQMLRREAIVSVAMIDLDHFKQLNDKFGHEAGDRALRAFADTARRALRDDDLIGRWGGEEFLVALPGLGRRDAALVLERIRSALAESAEKADRPAVTASFGLVDSTVTGVLDEAVRLADEALLAAKAQGRDRIVIGPVVVEPAEAVSSPTTS